MSTSRQTGVGNRFDPVRLSKRHARPVSSDSRPHYRRQGSQSLWHRALRPRRRRFALVETTWVVDADAVSKQPPRSAEVTRRRCPQRSSKHGNQYTVARVSGIRSDDADGLASGQLARRLDPPRLLAPTGVTYDDRLPPQAWPQSGLGRADSRPARCFSRCAFLRRIYSFNRDTESTARSDLGSPDGGAAIRSSPDTHSSAVRRHRAGGLLCPREIYNRQYDIPVDLRHNNADVRWRGRTGTAIVQPAPATTQTAGPASNHCSSIADHDQHECLCPTPTCFDT